MADRSPAEVAAFLDGHWDFNDPAATEDVFRALPAASDGGFSAQLQTQLARTMSLRRRFDEAHALLDGVESRLADEPDLIRVRYLLERGRTFNSAGEKDAARALFNEAFTLASGIDSTFYAVDAAHMLGIVETPEEALRWNERALALSADATDPRARNWTGSLCNNIGWTYHGLERFDEAMTMFERALAARLEQGNPGDIRIARWCIGRCLRSLGRTKEALVLQRDLLAAAGAASDDDGYTHEELAECLLLVGRGDEARPHFAKAHAVLSRDAWLVENEPDRLKRLAELGPAP